MNVVEKNILLYLLQNNIKSQRIIANNLKISLGSTNKAIKSLIEKEYLSKDLRIQNKAFNEVEAFKPKRAIILAAGIGIRIFPLNTEASKAFLEVKKEILIERIINQLHEVNINDITIVVGFMKESFEYLIDKYNVKLIVNRFYKEKNNLYSLSLVANILSNSYIIPCDIWCKENPFNENELFSWYMVSNAQTKESDVKVSRNMQLLKISKNSIGNKMIGIAYIGPDSASVIETKLNKWAMKDEFADLFWEETLYCDNKMILNAKLVENDNYYEINTSEDLKVLDSDSKSLNIEVIRLIKNVFKVTINEIKNVEVLKKGMTNHSFMFEVNDIKYIMRIPGEGTDKLIKRKQEYETYNAMKKYDISDEIIYINPDNGYKITKYFKNARTCDPYNNNDLRKCMKKLKEFHDLNIKTDYYFDIFSQIEFYESLRNGPSAYKDYEETKNNVKKLKKYIEKNIETKTLTHIDAVYDNFLLYNDNNEEKIKLIDWEYSGMQDPHVDIAMFAIYALYDKEHIDNLINIYFNNNCKINIRIKIYCYIAACGLLWSNWCEYKRNLGVEFGEYALKQYRYAKEYYRFANKLIKEGENNVSS